MMEQNAKPAPGAKKTGNNGNRDWKWRQYEDRFGTNTRRKRILCSIYSIMDGFDMWVTAELVMVKYNHQYRHGITMNQLANWLAKNPRAFVKSERPVRVPSGGAIGKVVSLWRTTGSLEREQKRKHSLSRIWRGNQ